MCVEDRDLVRVVRSNVPYAVSDCEDVLPVHHRSVHVERTRDYPDTVVVVHTTSEETVFG